MSNLTITVDDETLKRARLKALNQGRSVNELLRKFLESYAGVNADQAAAMRDLMERSRRAKSRHAGSRRRSREGLHERKQ
jgi:hypothetical protein